MEDSDDLEVTCRLLKLIQHIKPFNGEKISYERFSDFLKILEAAFQLYVPNYIKSSPQKFDRLKLQLLHQRLSDYALHYYSNLPPQSSTVLL